MPDFIGPIFIQRLAGTVGYTSSKKQQRIISNKLAIEKKKRDCCCCCCCCCWRITINRTIETFSLFFFLAGQCSLYHNRIFLFGCCWTASKETTSGSFFFPLLLSQQTTTHQQHRVILSSLSLKRCFLLYTLIVFLYVFAKKQLS